MSEQIVESPAVQAPVKVPVTTRDVLHRAADLLEEFGWCQGSCAVDVDGRATGECLPEAVAFCAGGAFARAWVDLGLGDPASCRVFTSQSLLSGPLGVESGQEQFWNDAPERTAAEVVARLREAAEASDG